MTKIRLLASVGVLGLYSGLFSAPLSASEGPSEDNNEISLEAQGTFQGFRLDAPVVSVDLPDAQSMADVISMRAGTPSVDLNTEVTGLDLARIRVGSPSSDAINPEIFVRDDVGLAASFDAEDTQPSVVQLFLQDNTTGGVFFNCTGSLINPRTVLTAAHCVNFNSSEDYGLPGSGAANSLLVSTGPNSATRLFTPGGYADGGVATSTDVVIHPTANLDEAGLPFPFADVALVALDAPITDVPVLPILLTPLTELTRVLHVGYGSFGTGLGGPPAAGSPDDNPFLRRIGENQLGALGSFADFDDVVFSDFAPNALTFGSSTNPFYFTDFDWPDRDELGFDGCDFNGNGPECLTLGDVISTDWFDGDALPREAGTAPGDSGSPLIVPDLYDQQVNVGVLSGGISFFRDFLNSVLGFDNTFGDISFYTPLYPYFQFINENTSYKYVSAVAGDGNWSDPNHWTQDLDPAFLIDDGNGNLINGVPEGEEDGIFSVGDSIGTVLGVDISEFPDIVSPFFDPADAVLPQSSVLLGEGSTGFVPQNTDGTPGTSFENPAQYFEVHLNQAGRTRVDVDVEIDKLVLDHVDAEFFLQRAFTFDTVIGYEQFAGTADIRGEFNAPLATLLGGLVTGGGVINSDFVLNTGAVIAPGGTGGIGTFTINGDYAHLDNAALLIDASFQRSGVTSDFLQVGGTAILGGDLIIAPRGRLRFAEETAVLSADAIDGNFENVFLTFNQPVLRLVSRVEGNEVIVGVEANSIAALFSGFDNLESVGAALDTLRFDGRYNEFAGLFDIVDSAGANSLVSTLSALTPVSAFGQSTIATNFSQRFTGQIAQRTLSLRGGNQAAAGFSAAGAGQAGIAQTQSGENSPIGFFSTISGQFLANAQERNTGANALEEAAFTRAGELTMGADVRMSEDLTIGFAMTSIRNGASQNGFQLRPDDTSLSGAAYAALQKGQAFTDMYFGFSRQNFGLERASQGDFSYAFDTVRGSARGAQSFGGARVGYAFNIAPGVEAGPVASVDYVRSELGGFTEFGAGQFGLTVLDRTFTSVGSKAGFMASFDTSVGRRGKLSAFGSAAYARELGDTQDVVTATFAGASDVPFSIVNQLDPNWVSLAGGLDLALGSRFSVSLTGQSDLGRGVLTNNQGRMNLNWKF